MRPMHVLRMSITRAMKTLLNEVYFPTLFILGTPILLGANDITSARKRNRIIATPKSTRAWKERRPRRRARGYIAIRNAAVRWLLVSRHWQ